jgi:hypothetical protein
VTYSLVITLEASKVVAAMDEATHELFVLAALDLPADPHGIGPLDHTEGAFTTRSLPLGSLGLIAYVIDETTATVTVFDIIWTG